MDFFLGIVIVVLWIIGFICSRIITTFIHEMGHAIPSLMYTTGPVKIHLGSYGDEKKSARFTIGRLTTFFKSDIVNWNIGMCAHQGVQNIRHQFIIILGGPLLSLILAIVLLLIIVFGNWNDGTITIFSVFIMASLADFVINLYPSDHPTFTENGKPILSDGAVLKQLIKTRNYPKEYFEAEKLLEEKKYDEAILILEKIIADGNDKKDFRWVLIDALSQANRFEEANIQIEILKEKKQIKTHDFQYLGNYSMLKKDYYEAITYFSNYLFKNFSDKIILNKRGACQIQISEYQKAFQDFNSAIIYDEKFADAYTNRGLANIRLGQLDAAKHDLEKAKSLDDSDPFIYLYLGYYFQEKNQLNLALENFKKAKAMEIDFHGIDYLIDTSKEHDFE